MMRFTGITFDPNFKTNAEKHFDRVQGYIDSECLMYSDPYVPIRQKVLVKSGVSGTVIGSGVIEYTAPYAKPNYYENRGMGIEGLNTGGGLRGRYWFERMKADHKDDILKGAKNVK